MNSVSPIRASLFGAAVICMVLVLIDGSRAPFARADESSDLNQLDLQLFEGLDAGIGVQNPSPATPSVPPNPIEKGRQTNSADGESDWKRLRYRMLRARDLLAETDPKRESQEIQARILADLETLLSRMSEHPSAAAAASPQPGQPTAASPAHENIPTGTVEAPDDRQLDAPRDQFLDRVWGHLPPRIRSELHAVGHDSFLPQYRDQIEAYFRSLAGETTRRGSPESQ